MFTGIFVLAPIDNSNHGESNPARALIADFIRKLAGPKNEDRVDHELESVSVPENVEIEKDKTAFAYQLASMGRSKIFVLLVPNDEEGHPDFQQQAKVKIVKPEQVEIKLHWIIKAREVLVNDLKKRKFNIETSDMKPTSLPAGYEQNEKTIKFGFTDKLGCLWIIEFNLNKEGSPIFAKDLTLPQQIVHIRNPG